jgi:hypothetical protein
MEYRTRSTTGKHALVNYPLDQTTREKGKMHIFLFANGEAIIEAGPGENIFLTRAQVVDLYTFFDSTSVRARMLSVMRDYLMAADEWGREVVQWIDQQRGAGA